MHRNTNTNRARHGAKFEENCEKSGWTGERDVGNVRNLRHSALSESVVIKTARP